MIIYKFFNTQFYTQNNIADSQKILNELKTKKLIFDQNILIQNLNKPAAYDFSTHYVNIPQNFFRTDTNYQQFTTIKKIFEKSTLDFIIRHEIGHLNHHKFLSLNTNNYSNQSLEYITLNSKSNYIKTNTSLDNLFDRTLSKDSPIDDFIHLNFTESYADAYACLTYYLSEQNLSIFDKTAKFRLNNFNLLKQYKFFNPLLNPNNPRILEISSGKFSTSRYSNILTSEYIKNNVIDIFTINQLNLLPIDKLHSLLQIEVLKSLNETLKNEINNNPLFNKDFSKYLADKNILINTYFNQFEQGIKEYQNKTILNIIQSSFINQNQILLNNFIDFHTNNSKFQAYPLTSHLLNDIDESKIHSLIFELTTNGYQLNKLSLSIFITDKYILPINALEEYLAPKKHLNLSNSKSNIIFNSIDSALLNSLITYNNNCISNNNTIPTLNNYSYSKIISIITQNLSPEDKKSFIDYINKNNIQDITTPYLSSSNAHVINEDTKQFQYKPKSAILSRIINITNEDKSNHEKSNSKKFNI